MAVFGAIPNNAPVLSKGKLHDVDWRGRSDKRGVLTVYHVGTVGAKHWLYSRPEHRCRQKCRRAHHPFQ
jgi:hypothetical protein